MWYRSQGGTQGLAAHDFEPIDPYRHIRDCSVEAHEPACGARHTGVGMRK